MKPNDYHNYYHTDMDYLDLEEETDYEEDDEYNEVYQYGVPLNKDEDEERYY